jgi:HEAT repeat protein
MIKEIRTFLNLNTSNQIKFLKENEFNLLDRSDKIDFLRRVLEEELSSKTIASILKVLRELKYRDQFFFRKFLYHVDSSVSNAARKAISDAIEQKDSGIIKITEILQKERGSDRLDYLKSILEDKSDFNADILISLLSIDDNRIREILVARVDNEYNLDESRLVEAIKGSVWFVRAAVVQILSNRNSEYLTEVIEYLLDDKNVEVKLKIIEALSKLNRDIAISYLERLKKDPLIWVKKEAEKALANLSHPSAE